MENEKLICKDCNEEFVFPHSITVDDLVKEGMNIQEAKKLFDSRDLLKSIVETTSNVVEKKDAEDKYFKLQRIIVDLSNGNSKEAYELKGFTNFPNRCPECRKKIKEGRNLESENTNQMQR